MIQKTPWGSWEVIEKGNRFQVKRLRLSVGQLTSLQYHHHRAEHLTVVQGTALVTVDNETVMVLEGGYVDIPPLTKHRIENPGKIPTIIIEVQTGGYLYEDDIVRLQDAYGRTGVAQE